VHREYVELKGSTNVGYIGTNSRFWIRLLSYAFCEALNSIHGEERHMEWAFVLGVWCLDKNVPFFLDARNILSGGDALYA
jgi:hypothetical protein